MKIKVSSILCIFLLLSLTVNAVFASENDSFISSDNENIELLIQNLRSSDTQIKSNAAKALVEIGDPAVEPLIEALESENYDIRENAAFVLGKIRNETAIVPLIEALSDPKWEVSHSAEIALGSIGEPAVEPLSDFIDGKEVSSSVIHAIGALGIIGEPAVEALIPLLGAEDEIAPTASYNLRTIGEPAEDALIPLLKHENPQIRYRAAEALIGTTNPDAVAPLTDLLDDENQYVRNFAKMALERMEIANTPVESTLYGRERDFFIEDEKRQWIDSLVPIVKGRSVYIEPYFYPDGPVISYGLNYQGYLTVGLLIGSQVNESYMAEIYGVIDEKARENGVEEVPVLFSFESMEVEVEEAIEEDVPFDGNLELAIKHNTSISVIQGFIAVMFLILLLGLCLSRTK